MHKLTTIAVGATIALGLSACGSSGSPEDTVKEFVGAAHDKDYDKYCELLAPETVKAFEQAQGKSCVDQMKESGSDEEFNIDKDKLKIIDSKEADDGKSATVSTEYDGEKSDVKLIKVDDEWRIDLGAPTGEGTP